MHLHSIPNREALCGITIDPALREIGYQPLAADGPNQGLAPHMRTLTLLDAIELEMGGACMPPKLWFNTCQWLFTNADGSASPVADMANVAGRCHGNTVVLQSPLPRHQVEPYALRLPCGHALNLSARAMLLTLEAEAEALHLLFKFGAVAEAPVHHHLAPHICNPHGAREQDALLNVWTPAVRWDEAGDVELVVVNGIDPVPLEFFSRHGSSSKDEVAAQVDAMFAAAQGKGASN